MKVFVICFLVAFVSCAPLEERQSNVNNVDNIQELLKELEKANININNDISNNKDKNTGRNDTPVRDALNRLFTSFQQMASAYVGVLTSVGKSIGIPTIPIGGVQFMQSEDQSSPIVIKQIGENIRQFQDSVQEVTKTVSNLVTREGPVDNYVLLTEVQKFMRLWSQQIQEVSEQVTRAFGGLEAEVVGAEVRHWPKPVKDAVNNIMDIFDQTLKSVNKMIGGENAPEPGTGQQPTNPNLRDEDKTSANSDALREFKNLLEIIQKRMKILSKQLDSLLTTPTSTDNLKAEHKDGENSI